MSTNDSTVRVIAAVGLLLMMSASGVSAQQTAAQQTCLNKLNMAGAAVAKSQGTASAACLNKAGMGTLVGSAQSCLTADAKGTVQKKKNVTTARETKFCGTAPTFGYTSAATINTAAVQGALDLEGDVFGGNLDTAVIPCASSKPGCQCQRAIFKKVRRLVAAKFSKFVRCKKMALPSATSNAALSACVNDAGTAGSIAEDHKNVIQNIVISLNTAIVNKCDTPGVTGAFPGLCDGMTGSALGTCLDTQVECRVCQMINDFDGLFINCDQFDDQTLNGSCASGAGPTPTPTQTNTPTETPTQTPTLTPCPPGPIFHGMLAASTGRFNYNMTIGIPGSDAACNSAFACTHTCTYAELQAADAANELLSVPDTSFWAIDSAQPANRQCFQVVPWDYQTAHTGRFGDLVPLTSGHLGALMPSTVCANPHSVGCCQ